MLGPLVECVPNFSEGRDRSVIEHCVQSVRSVPGAHVLHVDSNPDANRTVLTFAGSPTAVECAVQRLAVATLERIDMSRHHGAHPRIGALDVCPLVPLNGVSEGACLALAGRLAETLGSLGIPVYLYEHSARAAYRRDLPTLRQGGYEALAARLCDPRWHPDAGPVKFQPRCGATVLGVRRLLVAWNISLNSSDLSLARGIARAIRDTGAPNRPYRLAQCRAIGWSMPGYGTVQVSTNLLNFTVTGLAEVYRAVRNLAAESGVTVLGSELIGLVPRAALRGSGSSGRSHDDREQLLQAAQALGMALLRPFEVQDRVLEYCLAQALEIEPDNVPDFLVSR